MTHKTTLTYNVPLLRQAVLRFWWRTIGLRFFIALTIVAGSLIMLLSNGDTSWIVGALTTVLVIGLVFVAMIYLVHYRNSIRKLKAMGDPTAIFAVSETSLSFSSGAGSSTLPWSSVEEVWQFPNFWLLLFSKAQFVTVPLANVPPEFRQFVLERVRASGGKIG